MKEQTMHKDLSDGGRAELAEALDQFLFVQLDDLVQLGESLGLAREHLINIFPAAFDKAAEELDGGGQ